VEGSSNLDAALAAARRLCPPGTKGTVAERVLGGNYHLTHHHGPVFRVNHGDLKSSPVPPADVDYWTLEYKMHEGTVRVRLEWVSGGRESLGGAEVSIIDALRPIPFTVEPYTGPEFLSPERRP
jgi:hypothetical protein